MKQRRSSQTAFFQIFYSCLPHEAALKYGKGKKKMGTSKSASSLNWFSFQFFLYKYLSMQRATRAPASDDWRYRTVLLYSYLYLFHEVCQQCMGVVVMSFVLQPLQYDDVRDRSSLATYYCTPFWVTKAKHGYLPTVSALLLLKCCLRLGSSLDTHKAHVVRHCCVPRWLMVMNASYVCLQCNKLN